MAKTLLIEKETNGFINEQRAKEEGWYRLIYRCPDCRAKLGCTTHDAKRCFGASTVMKNNNLPKFCPDCGCRLADTESLSTTGCEEDYA